MTKLKFLLLLVVATLLLGPAPGTALAQGQFQAITGAEFDAAVPDTVHIANLDMPIQKRNAAVVQSPGGTRAFLALLDTTGYSSDVARKYTGAIVTEGGSLTIGGKTIAAGSYAFGWAVPPRGEEGPGTFSLYNQAGAKIAGSETSHDADLKAPRPLQVVILKNGTARLYLGRYSVELR